MTAPKALILRTSGTNCDLETAYGFELAGAEPERVHVQRFVDGERQLDEFQILVVPGGFSYGDDIAAGKLLANELVYRLKSPLERFVEDGKLVLGICNGFQVLVRAGLLPGVAGLGTQEATIAANDVGRFECRWVHLKTEPGPCVFTRGIDALIELPIAHGEGKFFAPEKTVVALESNGQVVFRYADAEGRTGPYPVNPNGSVRSIAGVCNPSGTVMGLMPHPERFIHSIQHPRRMREAIPVEGHGLAIFRNAVSYARERLL